MFSRLEVIALTLIGALAALVSVPLSAGFFTAFAALYAGTRVYRAWRLGAARARASRLMFGDED